MARIVSKFGGTSLAAADGFLRVRDIVMSDERRRWIVVSGAGARLGIASRGGYGPASVRQRPRRQRMSPSGVASITCSLPSR